MAKNFVEQGHTISVTGLPASVKSGHVVIVGALVAIALTDSNLANPTALAADGVYELDVASGVNITQGAKVYATATSGAVTTSETNNTYVGIAWSASAGGKVCVRLG